MRQSTNQGDPKLVTTSLCFKYCKTARERTPGMDNFISSTLGSSTVAVVRALTPVPYPIFDFSSTYRGYLNNLPSYGRVDYRQQMRQGVR